jgi:hypothetical protein
MEAEQPFRSRRRAPWFWQRGYSKLELGGVVVGGLALLVGLLLQFAFSNDVPGFTLQFIGLALLGAMLIRDWTIGRREEAAEAKSQPSP